MARRHDRQGEHGRGQEVDGVVGAGGQHVDEREEHQQQQRDADGHQQLLALAQGQPQLGAPAGRRSAPRSRRSAARPGTLGRPAPCRSRPPPVGAVARRRRRRSAAVRRRNTSSRRWRPARRSPRGRSCSASQAVSAATVGRGRPARRPGTRRAPLLDDRRRRGGAPARRRRGPRRRAEADLARPSARARSSAAVPVGQTGRGR